MVLCLVVPSVSQVKPSSAVQGNSNDSCPAPKPAFLNSLCGEIATQHKIEDDDSPFKFEIEKIVEEGACVVRSRDSEAQRNEKIRRMWTKYNDLFTCDSSDFNVPNGYMLKYAAMKDFEYFLKLAANTWKLPLDRVDNDGLTTLDYIQKEYQISERAQLPEAADLKRYYNILYKAGATHKKFKSIFIVEN